MATLKREELPRSASDTHFRGGYLDTSDNAATHCARSHGPHGGTRARRAPSAHPPAASRNGKAAGLPSQRPFRLPGSLRCGVQGRTARGSCSCSCSHAPCACQQCPRPGRLRDYSTSVGEAVAVRPTRRCVGGDQDQDGRAAGGAGARADFDGEGKLFVGWLPCRDPVLPLESWPCLHVRSVGAGPYLLRLRPHHSRGRSSCLPADRLADAILEQCLWPSIPCGPVLVVCLVRTSTIHRQGQRIHVALPVI